MTDEQKAKLSAACMGRRESLETRIKLSVAHRHCLPSDWKGFITLEDLLIRKSLEYAAWRSAVLERDNYTCQECGEHGGMGHTVRLEAHHIHEFAQYPDERLVVENGKTLCVKCHNKTKPGRPRKVQVSA